MGTSLTTAKSLQDPDQFCQRIMDTVVPLEGHELVAQRLPAVADWQKLLANLSVEMSGHTGAKGQHVWKFVKRKLVTAVTIDAASEQEGVEQSPNDVIFLCKDFMNSRELHQAPKLFATDASVASLNDIPLTLAPRNKLSVEMIREYRKTARIIKEKPWELNQASAYLTEWLDNNQGGMSLNNGKESMVQFPLVPAKVIFDGVSCKKSNLHKYEVDWADFAPKALSDIRVVSSAPKPTAKPAAPAAAAASDPVAVGAVPLPVPSRAHADPYAVPNPPPAGVDLSLGCSKCRKRENGCTLCKYKRAKRCAMAAGLPAPAPPPKVLKKICKRPAAQLGGG